MVVRNNLVRRVGSLAGCLFRAKLIFDITRKRVCSETIITETTQMRGMYRLGVGNGLRVGNNKSVAAVIICRGFRFIPTIPIISIISVISIVIIGIVGIIGSIGGIYR